MEAIWIDELPPKQNGRSSGKEGAYLNACSLYAIIAGKNPWDYQRHYVSSGRWKEEDFTIAVPTPRIFRTRWKIYQREIKNTKPSK